MVVGNLRTFSGDTYKIYMKEDGTSGEFEKIYETLVESPNELVNKNSISGFENIGIFFTQSLIGKLNWVTFNLINQQLLQMMIQLLTECY